MKGKVKANKETGKRSQQGRAFRETLVSLKQWAEKNWCWCDWSRNSNVKLFFIFFANALKKLLRSFWVVDTYEHFSQGTMTHTIKSKLSSAHHVNSSTFRGWRRNKSSANCICRVFRALSSPLVLSEPQSVTASKLASCSFKPCKR